MLSLDEGNPHIDFIQGKGPGVAKPSDSPLQEHQAP